MATPDIYTRKMIDCLTPQVKEVVKHHFVLDSLERSGCTAEGGFTGNVSIPEYPMERYSIFKATVEKGTYNHMASLVKWNGRYWTAWSNCAVNEAYPG